MADDNSNAPDDLVTGSIDDYLLALADGIHRAQRQLSQVSIDLQAGQPAVTYQLPKVDFEFRVSFELGAGAAAQGGAKPGETKPGGGLMLRPAGPGAPGAGGASAAAASIIKGSFVAVPARGGKPPPVMNIRLTRGSPRRLAIKVHVASAAGENLENIPVEFNVDHRLSARLNAGLGRELSKKTDVLTGRGFTNAEGIARTGLEVDPAEPVDTTIAVLVDAIGETQVVLFKVEEGTGP